jgi:hypothetical protein
MARKNQPAEWTYPSEGRIEPIEAEVAEPRYCTDRNEDYSPEEQEYLEQMHRAKRD